MAYVASHYVFAMLGQNFTVIDWKMSIRDHFWWTKLEGKGLKTGKLEQLREKEGWIVDVLGLKTIYIW